MRDEISGLIPHEMLQPELVGALLGLGAAGAAGLGDFFEDGDGAGPLGFRFEHRVGFEAGGERARERLRRDTTTQRQA